MIYKQILLEGRGQLELATEIMYNIASERASGVKLLRFDIDASDGERAARGALNKAIRILKGMKSRGAIQFIATADSFAGQTREAMFLLNKYPEYVENGGTEPENGCYVYISI